MIYFIDFHVFYPQVSAITFTASRYHAVVTCDTMTFDIKQF